MPELPEVETIRRQILPALAGGTVSHFRQSPFFKNLLKEKDRKFALEAKQLHTIERKGKYLFFKFQEQENFARNVQNSPSYMVSNLGMSGQWRLSEQSLIKSVPHTHAEFLFTFSNVTSGTFGEVQSRPNQIYLSYIDPRRFGRLYWVHEKRCQELREALGEDLEHAKWSAQKVYHLIHRYPGRVLKKTLLDQTLFAGSGNYIANEICARAGLLPTRLCGELSLGDCRRIQSAIKVVIRGAIKTQGTTFQGAYRDADGNPGEGVKHLVVFYQKTCQLCRKTPVQKIYIDGRGTYFCSLCQH